MTTSFKDFKKQFTPSLANKELHGISNWKQQNGGDAPDTNDYINNTIKQIDVLAPRMESIANNIITRVNGKK